MIQYLFPVFVYCLNILLINKIIHLAIKGKVNELVVAYKDRLTRFGFELIEDLLKEYSNSEIIIENEKKKKNQKKS